MGLRNRNLFIEKTCFFITTTCYEWLHLLTTDKRKLVIADSLNFVQQKYAFSILGYVIMPNHLHLLLNFNKENKLSEAMRDFKKFTSVQIRKSIEDAGDKVLLKKLRVANDLQIFKVWQDRFDDIWIGDKKLLETKLNYMHSNPLQAHWNLVKAPAQYGFSSASFYESNKENPVTLTDYRTIF